MYQTNSSLNEILDNVLVFLNEIYEKGHLSSLKHDEIREGYIKKYKSAPSELVLVLEYLQRSGMIINTTDKKFSISYEGKIYIENGGYTRKQFKENVKIASQNIRNWIITIGSILAGIYSMIQIGKESRVGNINFWTGAFLGLACTLTISLIWLIALEIRKKRT